MDQDIKIPPGIQDKTINEFGTELADKINTNTSAHTKEGEHEDEWDVWLISSEEVHAMHVQAVRGGQADALPLTHGMMVVMNTGATIGVIGKRERGQANNIRKGKPVRIRTAMGIVMKDMIGDLETSRGVLTG